MDNLRWAYWCGLDWKSQYSSWW